MTYLIIRYFIYTTKHNWSYFCNERQFLFKPFVVVFSFLFMHVFYIQIRLLLRKRDSGFFFKVRHQLYKECVFHMQGGSTNNQQCIFHSQDRSTNNNQYYQPLNTDNTKNSNWTGYTVLIWNGSAPRFSQSRRHKYSEI